MQAVTLDLRSIARTLGGDVTGGQVLAPGPGHSPRDRSLAIRLSAESPFGFIAHSHAGDDWRVCRDYVCQRLGLDRARSTNSYFRPKTLTRNQKPQIHKSDGYPLALWREAHPLRETLGEKYFREHRGLDVCKLDLDHVLRWLPRERCVVALMTDAVSNAPTGVHRTFLNADGSKRERKMLGRKGIIRLSSDDAVHEGLGICEGIEDGLAIVLGGWAPVWCAADAGALAAFPLLSGIEALTIFADADAPGMNAANACAERWGAAGCEVSITPPPRPTP